MRHAWVRKSILSVLFAATAWYPTTSGLAVGEQSPQVQADAGAGKAPAAAARPSAPMLSDPLRDPLQLLEALEKRRLELDQRARLVEGREEELRQLESRLSKRVDALQELRAAMQKDLAQEKNNNDSNIVRVARIFTSMKAQAAAERLSAMDHGMAVLILKNMKEKSAAKVLAKMDLQTASALSEDVGISMADKRRRQE
jgi:flagellar motility protein MotE (MotC chaperone)